MPTPSPSRPLRLLAAVSRKAALSPWRVIGTVAAILAVSLLLSSTLEIRSSLQELLPADMSSVANIRLLQERVGGDGNVLVNVESLAGPEGLGRAQAMARALAEDFIAMGPAQVRAVEWERNTTRRWFSSHWPLFASVDELAQARDAIRTEVRRRTQEANPLAVELDEADAEAPAAVSAAIDPAQPSPRRRVEQQFDRYLDGFLTHPDRSSVMIMVRPTGTAVSVEEARALVGRMRAVVERRAAELEQGHLRVGFAGSFPLFIAEYDAVVADVGLTGLITASIVIASMLLFFRDVRSTLALAISVAVAVVVNFGIARLTIGYLTTQTAFLGSVVAGDGLNYGLIYLARVRQLRRAGVGLVAACEEAARTTAVGTFLAAMATSVCFATLVFAANRGFRHFGIINGVGMMLCWISAFTLVPALLAVFEKVRPVRPSRQQSERRSRAIVTRVFAHPALVLGVFSAGVITAGAVAVARLPDAMEGDLRNVGNDVPRQSELRRDHDRAQSSIGRSISGAVALLDSRAGAEEFCDGVRARIPQQTARVIQGCETISSIVPLQQREKLAIIEEIRRELTDARLGRVGAGLRARLKEIRSDLASQRPLSDDDAPAALIDRFRERDGTIGRIAVVTASWDAMLELAPNLRAFVEGVRQVPVGGARVDAAGENVVFADLIDIVGREGPRTTVLSFLGVCAVILLVLRRRETSAQVIGALVAGVVLMAGITAVADLKINFFNFIAFPITFGISSDYAANIVTRVRERGGLVLESLIEVGPAVAMCSWSTIVGYGSLLLSLNQALRSFAWYAMIGEVTTLTSGLLMLPALLLLRDRIVTARALARRAAS